MNQPNPSTQHLLYEVNDSPPHRLAASLAAQTVALILTGIALTPIIALSALRERGEPSASTDGVRLGILSHMVEQLRHEQFNNADFLTLKVARRV